MMGSKPDEPGRSTDEARHRVELAQHFFMQRTEVTVGQFNHFVQSSGYRTDAEKGNGCWITGNGKGWRQRPGTSWEKPGSMTIDDDFPAICVTWNDARAFARWLSRKERKTYRLPTVDQTLYFSGMDDSGRRKLWATDGTRTGLVVDVNNGGAKFSPANLVGFSGKLYYTAYDIDHGEEFFRLAIPN